MADKTKSVNLLTWLKTKALSNVAFTGDYDDLIHAPEYNNLLNLTVVYSDNTTETIPLLTATSISSS